MHQNADKLERGDASASSQSMGLVRDKFLTVRQCAILRDCHTATIWRMAKLGTFPAPIKIGHLTRWSEMEVQSFLSANRTS